MKTINCVIYTLYDTVNAHAFSEYLAISFIIYVVHVKLSTVLRGPWAVTFDPEGPHDVMFLTELARCGCEAPSE